MFDYDKVFKYGNDYMTPLVITKFLNSLKRRFHLKKVEIENHYNYTTPHEYQ